MVFVRNVEELFHHSINFHFEIMQKHVRKNVKNNYTLQPLIYLQKIK